MLLKINNKKVKRLFLAVVLDKQAIKELDKKLFKPLLKKHWKVKWQKIEKLHLTLAFLGNVPEIRLPLIGACIRKAVKNISKFNISFKGLGCFPDYELPEIIWLGLKGEIQKLAHLQKQIKTNLKFNKVKFDEKPFFPHMTIGRIKKCSYGERREIGRQLKSLRILNLQSIITIDKVIIYESRILAKASKYLEIDSIKLKD